MTTDHAPEALWLLTVARDQLARVYEAVLIANWHHTAGDHLETVLRHIEDAGEALNALLREDEDDDDDPHHG